MVGAGLTAVAWADDGIIEGIESTTPGEFLVGVQWHPEQGDRPPAVPRPGHGGGNALRGTDRFFAPTAPGWGIAAQYVPITGLSWEDIPLRPACFPGIPVDFPVGCCAIVSGRDSSLPRRDGRHADATGANGCGVIHGREALHGPSRASVPGIGAGLVGTGICAALALARSRRRRRRAHRPAAPGVAGDGRHRAGHRLPQEPAGRCRRSHGPFGPKICSYSGGPGALPGPAAAARRDRRARLPAGRRDRRPGTGGGAWRALAASPGVAAVIPDSPIAGPTRPPTRPPPTAAAAAPAPPATTVKTPPGACSADPAARAGRARAHPHRLDGGRARRPRARSATPGRA